MVIDNYIAT